MLTCTKCKKIKKESEFHKKLPAPINPLSKKFRSQCKNCENKWHREYNSTPNGKIKRNLRSYKYQSNLRLKVIEKLGGKCFICSFSDNRALQVDHVNGGGTKLNRLKSWSIRYLGILNGTTDIKYQVLCANCNWIKRYTSKEVGGAYE